MACSYSDRDLSYVPQLTFSIVEEYCKSKKESSGHKSMNKGLKYFSEGYIHDIKIQPLSDGSAVTAKCHRSQKKNESPHQLKVNFAACKENPTVTKADCTCPIGLSEACGHVIGLLYQLAKFKVLGEKAVPEDVAKTSQPQTWHMPRGDRIKGKAVQQLEVGGYSNSHGSNYDTAPRTIKSTLYNPVRTEPIDWPGNYEVMSNAAPTFLILPALQATGQAQATTRFGPVPRGSVLSYQQKLDDEYVMNICDGVGFPDMPVKNVMLNSYSTALSGTQMTKLNGLAISRQEIKRFEEQTRLQSATRLWYRIRKHRITASNVGDIFKRRKDEETLVARLQSTRHVTTAAMKQGLASEPTAARSYAAEARQGTINLYPCGVVVSFWAPWIAASPDRKVYYPERTPAFGLLEIKCPQVTSVLEVPYLKRDETGFLKLKRNHKYYYQILTQLAVTGLDWCDFYVWCTNDHHLETVYFNSEVWQVVKNKLDLFYFNYFL